MMLKRKVSSSATLRVLFGINPPPLLKLNREQGGGYFHQQWQGYVMVPTYVYLSEQAQQWQQQKVNNGW